MISFLSSVLTKVIVGGVASPLPDREVRSLRTSKKRIFAIQRYKKKNREKSRLLSNRLAEIRH